MRAAPWWLPALPSDHVDINAGQAVVPRGAATFQFPTPSFYNSALFPQHSTCENHAYAATQLVRKRQRANQQASGSRSPQHSSTVQSRRADARGILEAEEGGEVLARSLSLSPSLYSPTPAPNHSRLFLLSCFFHPFSRSSLALRSRTLIFSNLLFLGKRFRSRFFSTRKTVESPR